MKNISKLFVVLGASTLLLGACSKEFIQKDKPYSMTEAITYGDADYIEASLLGCYSVFKSTNPTFMGGLAYIVFDCRGDDIVNVSNPVTMEDTYEMRVLATSDENNRIWNYAYYTINTCNIFMDKLEEYNCKEVLGDEIYKQYVAEAKFIRAYCYYVLANLYSQPYIKNPNALAVPLRLTGLTSSGNNDCPESTISEIYKQILEDCIPDDLPDNPGTYDITRASAAAAHMLRMRIYMAMSDWTNAIKEGEAVKGYELVSDMTSLYGVDTYKGGKELIFALPMSTQDNPNTQMSCAEYFSAQATVSWLDTEGGILANADYSLAGDQRVSKLISDPDGNGYVYSKKFTDYAQKLDWIPVFRYAETLLNLAECYNNEGQSTPAKAALKQVRGRAIPEGDTIDVDALSGGNLTTAIINERRAEFICEGIRGVDIIRRGETFVKKNTLFEISVGPDSGAYYWPIPDAEKNFNKALKK